MSALELADGRVIVLDQGPNEISDLGGPPTGPIRPEILNPVTGAWKRVAALNAPRSEFLAVRLNDGRILVTGGNNGWFAAYSSTKLLDPATGRWAAAGRLSTARMAPIGALLPDGRVLVAGGTFSEGWRDEEDFQSGRIPPHREPRTAELYDPATGRWTMTGSLHHVESAGAAFVLPDGRVLAALTTCEVYEPRSGRWKDLPACFERPDGSATVVLGDGSLLVIGGWKETRETRADGSTRWVYPGLSSVVRFDPATGTSSDAAPLPLARGGAVAVRLADGRVLVAGGTEELGAPPSSASFIYDPVGDTWTESTPLPFADLPGQALLLSDGRVIIVGGRVPRGEEVADAPSTVPVGWTAVFELSGDVGG